MNGLATDLPGHGTADLVDQFAYPLPVSVICGLLGVPPQDEPQFRVWTEGIVKGLDAQEQEGADELIALRDKCQAEMFVYVNGLVGKHREHPDGSMLSDLANDPDAMTDAELGTTSVLLLIAGHETTVNLTANGIAHPAAPPRHAGAAARRARSGPWRWSRNCSATSRRCSTCPTGSPWRTSQVGSVTIPRGARLILLLAAAGRDPERFDHPDRFDPDRADNEHLGFGSGIHYCFGAPLARLEAALSLTTLARRLVSPRLASDPPPYRPSPVLRGPVHLPVTYDNRRD